MKKIFFPCYLTLLLLAGCHHRNTPDVSGIDIQMDTVRFERSFFTLDTLYEDSSLESLNRRYPGFTADFLYRIMGANANPDSTLRDVRLFLSAYRSVYDSAMQQFPGIGEMTKQIKHGLQFVKYYFPAYALPHRLYTFVGPIDAVFKTANGVSGDVITKDGLGVALQLHLGKYFSLYRTENAQELYPLFVSRRFEAGYIPVNCMRNIIEDMYPDKSANRPLIEQMVEAGKRLYVLDALMPDTPDSLKTGYTQAQLMGCYQHESNIWSFFVQNDLLYATDSNVTGSYMNDGPKTTELGDASPGFIGQFVGWQIVKKWMEKNDVDLKHLMEKNDKELFTEAKYKP